MGLLCVNHETGRSSWSSTLITCAPDDSRPSSPLRYVRRLTPGSPPRWKPPTHRSLTRRTRSDITWNSGNSIFRDGDSRERAGQRSSRLVSSLIGTLRAPCIPACVPRARPPPTYADLSHITSSTHLGQPRMPRRCSGSSDDADAVGPSRSSIAAKLALVDSEARASEERGPAPRRSRR